MSPPHESYKCPLCKGVHPISTAVCPVKDEEVLPVFRMTGRLLDGKFRVGSLIKAGGMGVVYEGEHETIKRRLAIKFIHPDAMASKHGVARFQNEARATADIGHPHIIKILDMGTTDDGVPYIVMERLVGMTLRDVMRREGTLPVTDAIRITVQILDALGAVHSCGIVHRDLKPDNVFLAEEAGGDRIVKVFDFGLSRLGETRSGKPLDLTQTGTVVGTPKYMSPEQARNSKDVDPRTDLYSMGVVLYRMLTDRLPIEAENHNEFVIALATEDPVPPSTHRPDLPPGLDDVILRALSRSADDRYPNANRFAMALAGFLEEDDEESSLVTDLPRLGQPGSSGLRPALGSPGPLSPDTLSGSWPRSGVGKPSGVASQSGMKSASEMPPSRSEHEFVTVPVSGSQSVEASSAPASMEWTAPTETPRPARRSRWVLVPILVAGIACVLGAAGFLVYKLVTLEETLASRQQQASAQAPREETTAPPSTSPEETSWSIALDGLPEGASVYVDGVLHPERPLRVHGKEGHRRIQVEADGYLTWRKVVSVTSDIDVEVVMEPAPPPEETPEDESGKSGGKKGGKKKVKPRGDEHEPPAGDEPREKIDTQYPGI